MIRPRRVAHLPGGLPCGLLALLALAFGCGRVGFDPLDGVLLRDAPGDTITSDCPSFAMFCDDFESGGLEKWTGSDFSVGAVAVVDRTESHSGVYGLDATVPPEPGDGAAAAATLSIAAQSTGMLAVREWIDLSAPLIDYEAVMIIANGSPLRYVAVGAESSGLWNAGEDSTVGGLIDHPSSVPAPALGVWTCVELDYTFPSGGPAGIQLFVSDVTVVDVAAADPSPVYNDVEIGVARANMAGYHVWNDDVVIAQQHIGCQ